MEHFLLTRHLLGSVRTLEKKEASLCWLRSAPAALHTQTHTQSVATTPQIDATLELRNKLRQVNATSPTIPAPYMYIGNSAPVWTGKNLIYRERRRPVHTAEITSPSFFFGFFGFFRRLLIFVSLHTHEEHFIKVVVAQLLCLCFHSLNTLPC